MEFLLFWIFVGALLFPIAVSLDKKRNNQK